MLKKQVQNICRYISPIYIGTYLRYQINRLGLTPESKAIKKKNGKNIEHFKDCKNSLYQFGCDFPKAANLFIDTYKNKTVKSVKVLDVPLDENDAIALCVVKDDLLRVKAHIEYHRQIGIKHFAYIDNMSTDGTFEWLKEQKDVSLFRTDEKFCGGTVQFAWRRQVTDLFGYERWYLNLDSDELFMYPGVESKKINEYICFLEKNKINSAFSLMVDMYAKGKIFEMTGNYDFIKDYCYFDVDTYKKRYHYTFPNINGGPQVRVFSTKGWQTKFPLSKISKSMICNNHYNFPVKLNWGVEAPIAFLLHYKFLPSDNVKYKNIAKSGNYALGSQKYKRYVEALNKKPDISFYFNRSQKFNNSMDLLKLKVIDKVFLKNFLNFKIIK